MGMIKIPQNSIKKFNSLYEEIFTSGDLAEGKYNRKLAEFIKKYTNAKYSNIFSSNGSGVLAILLCLKRYWGRNKIFIQSNTMYGVKTMSISSGLNYIGAVDSSLNTLMPTIKQVKDFVSKIEDPTDCVFLLSHIGGIVNPDIEAIAKFCHQEGIILIEDCAHSFGSTLNGKHTGLFGLAGVYSFYATKAITAGEGGASVTNSEILANQLSKFNIYDRFEQTQDIGVNFRMSELQALFTLCVCEEVEEIISNKNLIANKYIEVCEDLGISYIKPNTSSQRGNHYKFTILNLPESKTKVKFDKIKSKTSCVYDYSLGEDPENIKQNHLCLPIWYQLEGNVIEQTIAELKSSF